MRCNPTDPISLCIEIASEEYASELVQFFRCHPNVELLAWQDEVQLRKQLSNHTVIAFLVRGISGQIIAALIGGTIGTRGMINHVAVDATFRHIGIGRMLVEAFEQEMKLRNIQRYFLFVAKNNGNAMKFWGNMKLRSTMTEEITLERDLGC